VGESNVTRLGQCDEQANKGLNPKHDCGEHEVVWSRKGKVAGNCKEPSIGLATLVGALTGKDGTETGGVRAKERAGRGDSRLWESMDHTNGLMRLRQSEVADGRLNDVAGVRELGRAMGRVSAGDWCKRVGRKGKAGWSSIQRGQAEWLKRRMKGCNLGHWEKKDSCELD